MLDIAFDLIVEATSNSLLMFCFCNLIIVMILTGSSKPSSKDSQDSTFITPVSYNMCSIASDDRDCGEDEEITVADISSEEDEERGSSDKDHDDEIKEAEVEEEEEDDDEIKEAEVEEEEEDDELRKRAEEFIAKINNEWRHEKLKALNLVY